MDILDEYKYTSAFPSDPESTIEFAGLTKFEYIASQQLQGLLSRPDVALDKLDLRDLSDMACSHTIALIQSMNEVLASTRTLDDEDEDEDEEYEDEVPAAEDALARLDHTMTRFYNEG